MLYRCLLAFICLLFNYSLGVYAQTLSQYETPKVLFYPGKTLHLDYRPDHYFHRTLNQYILNNIKTEGLLLTNRPLRHKSDYYLRLEHAMGCPDITFDTYCHIMVTWNLYRGDDAPVMSWESFYPLEIPLEYHKSRFKDFKVPVELIDKIGDDFIKSLIYETLKHQEYDYVYVLPDQLEDNTTLCSADSLYETYFNAGLYVTDAAYKARFLLKTQIQRLQPQENHTTLLVRRIIVDRATGNFKIFPIRTQVENNFLANDSYDCHQAALLTMKHVGHFIDKAP